MSLRLAAVDNLSAYSFRLTPPSFPATMTFGSPAFTGQAMAGGEFDAALVPVAALGRMRNVRPLPYGIACTGAVSSVLLFTREPIHAILRDGKPIHVTPKSQSSRQLLCMLCRASHGMTPVLTEAPSARARLLIGNEASDSRREEHFWPGVYDLGQWWYQVTGHPFVFAQWVVSTKLGLEDQAAVERWLEEAARYAESASGLRELAGMVTGEQLFHASPAHARRYYLKVRPRLGAEDLEGLKHFLALQAEDLPCALTA